MLLFNVIISLPMEKEWLKYNNTNIYKENNYYFGYSKCYPQKNWHKLFINVFKDKNQIIPETYIVSGIICYGIDNFILDVVKSRYCKFFRNFIFFTFNYYLIKHELNIFLKSKQITLGEKYGK